MKMTFAFIGAAICLMVSNTAFAANDPFVSEFSGNCPESQCTVEIDKKAAKNYAFTFTAMNSMDASKVLCQKKASLTKEKSGKKQILTGTVDNQKIEITTDNQGSVTVKGNLKCGKYKVSGKYEEFGDY